MMKITVPPQYFGKTLAALCVSMAAASPAVAMELDFGGSDWDVRWDNSFRYNLQARLDGRDSRFKNNSGSDEGNYKFDRGDITSNRLDILSELEVGWRKTHGFRVSASGWVDHAYRNTDVKQSPELERQGYLSSYIDDEYSSTTKRYHRGPSGEILDAFVYGNFSVAGMPLSVKAGQHVVYWGNSVFTNSGIAYSQAPTDGLKGAAAPGSEARELFLPLNQISATLQATDQLSFAAQYFLDWDHTRVPQGGTFLGSSDSVLTGPDRLGGLSSMVRGKIVDPDKRGDWGVNAKYNFINWNASTVGLYYRKFSEKVFWLLTNPDNPNEYRAVYPEDTELYGLSVDTSIGRFAVGGEVAYRKNTGLSTIGLSNSYEGARGNMYNVVLNTIFGLTQNSLWDAGSVTAELTYNYLDKVTKNKHLFNGEDSAHCTYGKWQGCATDHALGMQVRFSPQWSQVFPGVDLTVPISYSTGLKGNTAAFSGTSQGASSYSIGAELDIRNQWTAALTWADSSAEIKRRNGRYIGNGGWQTTDRGRIALTIKTAF